MASKTFQTNIDIQGSGAFSSSVTASSIIKSGGTSAQFLMADGSVSSGGGVAGATATHSQSVASTTWTFNHNIGQWFPVITVYNASNAVVIPASITATSVNQVVITFSTALAGNAVAILGGTGAQGIQGIQGIQGVGISSVVRTTGTGAAGTTDTYTITYTNATTSTFTVYNGANGTGDMQKSVYDTNNNGIVDNSALVNGLSVLTAVPAGALFTDTVYTLPFTNNSVNWNTAYSWGNHAGLYSLLAHNHAGLYEPVIGLGTTAQYLRGDKTWQTLPIYTPTSLGLVIGTNVQAYNANTTIQGNVFNGINQLVKLDGIGKLPAIDGSQLINLPVGSTSPLTTKGDLYGFSTVGARIPIGTNNQVLTADSTQPLGLKWADAASGGGSVGSKSFVASGTIGAGKAVGLRSDGKVEIITNVTQSNIYGTPVDTLQSSGLQSDYQGVIFHPTQNKIVYYYVNSNNNNALTVLVGTVDGTTITFGSPVVSSFTGVSRCKAVYSTIDDKIVFFAGTSVTTAFTGTVTGTTISFGAGTQVTSNVSYYFSPYYDSVNNKVILAYQLSASAYVRFLTISGTTITAGTETTVHNNIDVVKACFHTGNGVGLVIYKTLADNYMSMRTVSLSGSTFTLTSNAGISSEVSTPMDCIYLPESNKIAISYIYTDELTFYDIHITTFTLTSYYLAAVGNWYTDANNLSYFNLTYDSLNGKILFSYGDYYLAHQGAIKVLNVSPTTGALTSSNIIIYQSARLASRCTTYDSFHNRIVTFANVGYSQAIQASVIVTTAVTTNANTFVGITEAAISNLASGKVTILAGVNAAQSGLTIGAKYYVDYTGAFVTSPNLAYSNVLVGRALSATELLVENLS